MEDVDSFHLLTRTDEFDRLRDHGTDREGGTTAGIAIELCEHHAIEIEAVIELLSGVDRILTGHGVDDKQCLIGMDMLFERRDLIHHLLIDSQTAGGIDNDDIVTFGFGLSDSMVGNLIDVFVLGLTVHRHADTVAHDLQLVDGSRTIDITSHEQWVLVLLGLEHVGELATKRGLTRTLKTGHKDDSRLAREMEL